MVERIESIERVKGINYDVGRRDKDESADKDATGKKFAEYLKKANKKTPQQSAKIGEAYQLDVRKATQSLFYNGDIDFRAIRRNLSAYL